MSIEESYFARNTVAEKLARDEVVSSMLVKIVQDCHREQFAR